MSIERMQTLLDDIATTLSCPVVLDDERQRLLAYTDHDVTADDVRVASILARRATPEIRTWFEQWGILEATAPVRTPRTARSDRSRWVVPLRHEGMLLGFVSVLDRGRLTREQLEPVMESTAAIAETLYVARRAEPRVSALLQLLVLPRHSEGDDVSARRRGRCTPTRDRSRWSRSPSVVRCRPRWHAGAAGCRPARLPGLPGTDRALRRDCRNRRCARAPALRRRCRPRRPSGRRVIGGTADVPDVVAGISSGAWTAGSAARAYSESIRALRIPLADPTAAAISSWDHAGAFRALTLLPVAGDSDPIDPRVRALLAHPQLARTVEAFLDNAGDAGTTARQLRIHRATLYQRLTRVSDLCALTSSGPVTTVSRPTSGCASRRSRASGRRRRRSTRQTVEADRPGGGSQPARSIRARAARGS